LCSKSESVSNAGSIVWSTVKVAASAPKTAAGRGADTDGVASVGRPVHDRPDAAVRVHAEVAEAVSSARGGGVGEGPEHVPINSSSVAISGGVIQCQVNGGRVAWRPFASSADSAEVLGRFEERGPLDERDRVM